MVGVEAQARAATICGAYRVVRPLCSKCVAINSTSCGGSIYVNAELRQQQQQQQQGLENYINNNNNTNNILSQFIIYLGNTTAPSMIVKQWVPRQIDLLLLWVPVCSTSTIIMMRKFTQAVVECTLFS